jgi:flavin-binding protein dodecin
LIACGGCPRALRARSSPCRIGPIGTSNEEGNMSVYRVIDVVGTSTTSWEEAAADAINTARQSVRDLRVAEVVKQDIHIGDGGELIYRTKIQLSFKYESES